MTISPSSHSDTALLIARGVVKSFPGVRALDGVDFVLRRGEIHTLMGENGAGKSTLIKVLTGVYARDGGDILLARQPIHPRSPLDAQRLGISTVYQEVNLIPYLTVAENIALGRQPKRFGFIRWREINRRARTALARLDLDIDVTRPLNSYSIAIQQLVAIARAVDIDAKVLILDEPTSSLTANEVQRLFGVMRKLKAQGLGIVFVSHFLDQVYAISDRFTVLRNGRLVGEYEAANLPRLELIAKMLGRDVEAVQQMTTKHAQPTPVEHRPLVRAQGLGRRGSIKPIDLEIRAGEIVGLAGLLGSGRTETARLLFGIDPPDSGTLYVEERPVAVRSPRKAIAVGFGFTPEDRKTDGIVPELSIRENIILALQARRGWLRPLRRRKQRELADHYVKALGIATPDAEKPIGQLSGGNQQKALLARWLASQPRLLIVDEPTRGIDVGAKAEIEKLLANLCQQGMGVLFISSELEEVARDCHRVIVLRDRAKVGELTGEQRDVHHIMHLIAAEA
jgi:simple sugar transport system ATP-binding protein